MDLAQLHEIGAKMPRDAWARLWIDHAGGEPVAVALPPFPDEATQKITNNIAGAATMRGAAAFYAVVDEEIARQFGDRSDLRLLDHGAGWGRITRLLLRSIAPANLFAVDVDARLVEAGRESLPGVRFERVESNATLPFDPGAFDVVVSNSVFSHLSPDAHMFYVREIARLLRPGGLFLGTTLGLRHLEGWLASDQSRGWITGVIGDADAAKARIAAGEVVYGPTARWPDYGIAILPEGWAAANWDPDFEVARTREDYSQFVQVAVRR